jgi:protein-tyrosine kinase
MDKIRKALERAQSVTVGNSRPSGQIPPVAPPIRAANRNASPGGREITLNGAYLENQRIISYDITDHRSKAFDILRTQVLQSMDMKGWQALGITSPTAGCGKTLSAINLAFSIARQPERSVLLIDLDLQKPAIAEQLGVSTKNGVLSVLDGRSSLSSTIIHAQIRNQKLAVLPIEAPTLRSSEWMASRAMATLMQDIKREFRGYTVIIDLPPILTSDDVITILPQLDCILFVTAAGLTTASQIKECNKHLEMTPVVRVVLNKAIGETTRYYSGYGSSSSIRR